MKKGQTAITQQKKNSNKKMLFSSFHFKALVIMINSGDDWKDKQAQQNTWPLLGKNFSCEFFVFVLLSSYLFWSFYKFDLQLYREISKKNRIGAIKDLRNTF